jgi:hypothetical protein
MFCSCVASRTASGTTRPCGPFTVTDGAFASMASTVPVNVCCLGLGSRRAVFPLRRRRRRSGRRVAGLTQVHGDGCEIGGGDPISHSQAVEPFHLLRRLNLDAVARGPLQSDRAVRLVDGLDRCRAGDRAWIPELAFLRCWRASAGMPAGKHNTRNRQFAS